MVAPVHNLDPTILPEGSAKLRWGGGGGARDRVRKILFIFGEQRSCDGRGGRAAPLWAWQWVKKDRCARRTGAHARPKPTSKRYLRKIMEGERGENSNNVPTLFVMTNIKCEALAVKMRTTFFGIQIITDFRFAAGSLWTRTCCSPSPRGPGYIQQLTCWSSLRRRYLHLPSSPCSYSTLE